MTTPAKRIVTTIVAQSNPRGKAYFGTGAISTGWTGIENETTYGCPSRDPIRPLGSGASPGTGNYGTPWPVVAQWLADNRNIWCITRNSAIGGTTAVVDWCGRNGSTGTDPMFAKGDGGYDPNLYFQDTLDDMQLGTNIDERWIIFMHGFGDADAGNDVSQANYADAHINMITDARTQIPGVRVAVGLTGLRYSTTPVAKQTWFQTTAPAAIADVIAAFPSDGSVIAGVNLDSAWGGVVPLATGDDDAHWGAQAYTDAGILIAQNLSAAIA